MRIPARLALATSLLISSLSANAGGFMFAWMEHFDFVDSNPERITHMMGYEGEDNQHLQISVCISPDSAHKSELEIPLKNAITTWNQLDPVLGNTTTNDPEVSTGVLDVESVLMHEIGHCIGLAHPNLGKESGLVGSDREFAKTTPGPSGQYDLDAGPDGVIGTREDRRGDDVNVNWFRRADNDPFAYSGPFDATTFSVDVEDLPDGHDHVEIARLDVARHRGHPDDETVMNHVIRHHSTRRNLNRTDAAMIRLAMSGIDREQGTSKDYTFELYYSGVDEDCDIQVSLEGTDLGRCIISASRIDGDDNHWAISSASIRMDPSVNWHFSTVSLDELFFDRFEDQD